MILIYTEEITPRIEYAVRLILSGILKIEVTFTTNSAKFLHSSLPRINYSSEKFGDEIYIRPNRIMLCKTIIAPAIHSVWHEGEKYFFESSPDSILPFDPFAASFYLVTRHEEYTEKSRDRLGRFTPEKSILTRYNLLKKPVVNIWANILREKINHRYPDLVFPEKKFSFISTIDIDNAWAYLHKGLWRTAGAFIRDTLKGNFAGVRARLRTSFQPENDPYDTYGFMDSVFKGNENNVKYFFLLGNYGRYDKNVSFRNRNLAKLIKSLSKKYETGIHPSFAAGKKGGGKRVKMEKKRLESITGKNVRISRQHFLRLKFPATYRRLLKAGIKEDYTMGYSASTGFRAGICTPYYFYDLKKEKTTNLLIVPFQVMDGTLKHYLRLEPEKAYLEIESLMKEVKKIGGTFVSIWHNETVNDKGIWKGYRKVFEKMNRLGFEWAEQEK